MVVTHWTHFTQPLWQRDVMVGCEENSLSRASGKSIYIFALPIFCLKHQKGESVPLRMEAMC